MTRAFSSPRPHDETTLLSLVWCLACLAAWPLPVQPAGLGSARARNQQPAITIDSTGVSHTFGTQITFTLAAHSPNGIIEAALLMRLGADSRTEVLPAEFIPGQSIDARAARDLEAHPVAPFATLLYSWRLVDSAGNILTTPEQPYLYDDDRFQWQTVDRDPIHAHWHSGDVTFGHALADIGYEALIGVSDSMDAALPGRLDIYVYEQLADLQSGLSLGGRAWVGGHADPSLGVVLVYGTDDPFELIRLESDMAHELAHVMVYQVVGPNYRRMPVWLDEGLATHAELQPRPQYAEALITAVGTETLIPLQSLCGTFGIETSRAILSYAESGSIVRYIQDRWGPATMRQLLAAYSQGASCEGGVQRSLNLSLAQLQADWESDVLRTNPLRAFLRAYFPYLLIFGPIALIIAALLFVPKRTADDGRPTTP
jgi:hypothetical protein